MDSQAGGTTRTSSGASLERSSRDRRQNPQQQVSQIEKSVTQLLVATKQLLETLTQWSRGTATETQVSDIYVRLGYEFNIACRAFGAIGVETSDLGPVPDLLRSILEETLSQEASQASLDRFLPRIRDIIINLLQGLKKKQSRLRQKNGRDGNLLNGASRQSNTSIVSADDSISRQAATKSMLDRSGQDSVAPNARSSSIPNRQGSPSRQDGSSNLENDIQRTAQDFSFASSGPSSTVQSNTRAPTGPAPNYSRDINNTSSTAQTAPPVFNSDLAPPRARQQDALAALQSGGELERRASRRFSAYQIHKHLGATSSIPNIPSVQTPPIPNRGRDTKESMNAVRVRGSNLQGRERSKNGLTSDSSPSRFSTITHSIAEESLQSTAAQLREESPSTANLIYSEPSLPQPQSRSTFNDEVPKFSATLSSPLHSSPVYQASDGPSPMENETDRQSDYAPTKQVFELPTPSSEPKQFTQTPIPASKELTLFLQYKTKIKKFVLPGGYEELSVGRLQLAFIEKFAWNTHNNGDLPEIYIQDPVSGVRHELEDLRDVKNSSVLVLNVDILDEVKRHVDDGLSGIRRVVEGVKTAVDDQNAALQRVSDRQQETVKEVARLAALPPPSRTSDPIPNGPVTSTTLRGGSTKLGEVQALRRDLAVIRQTCSSFFLDMEASMATIRTKASAVKSVAVKAALPSFEGDSGRIYVNAGKKSLSEDSEKIVNRVDDLQDLVEDLRKDVVTRGVRPLPRQLEEVSKDISAATAQLKKLQEFLKREKPLWTKIWETELQVVCDDRDLLTMQEELAADLEDDLEKAAQTFALVEQATKQQNLQNAQGNTSRSTSRNVIDIPVDPQKAKDGVLGEVRALQPNHDTRLEAIERAEKARQRELANRKEGEFGKELGSFVEEGKLKKSGGVEEAERLRKAKDDRIRKEFWERQNPAAASKEATIVSAPSSEAPVSSQEVSPAEPAASSTAQEIESDEKSKTQPSEPERSSASPEPVFVEASEEATAAAPVSTTDSSADANKDATQSS